MNIEQYKNIPFKSHGRNEQGLDCWGLVHLVYREQLDIVLPAWSHLYEDACSANLKTIQGTTEAFGRWVQVDKPKPCDVALFEVGRGLHVGLCIDKKGCRVLHITKGIHVTIEDIRTSNWKRRFKGFYRYDR